MPLRYIAVIAFASSVVALGGCRATHRDSSAESPYKEHIGQVCEVARPLSAMGYTFNVERNRKTDAIAIWHYSSSGPEVTFKTAIPAGTKMMFLEARECTNCPFDLNPEYRVRVSPEPQQFGGKPAYLRAASLNEGYLRCSGMKVQPNPSINTDAAPKPQGQSELSPIGGRVN